ncbi:unnamed protein product [Spodoptera littoralis]|uniref:Peptidase S1 domain-containing protein n=1 Tax=Spodoptera littoralis TaxID=7109 RepID=A0A9P0I5T3_SPOLI|nr:unnamed protein product [Spodoptera littoralis]CAH1640551.1 unnamed protein product [Spodoptera littoralis]
MVIRINVGIIRTVFISIVVNNVIRIAATDLSADDGQLFNNDEEAVDSQNQYNNEQPKFKVQETIVKQKDDYDKEEDIKALLEEKYKFKNDETSTRFKVTKEERGQFPVFPENHDERHIAWAFRSYAVRRIVGGMETSVSMYPYNVAISRNAKHWCGGSIIDEQWVLTAGHCLESAFDGDKRKLQPFIIRAGSSFHNRGGYQARVNKVFFPHEYVPGNADYDYSLLRLDRPMPIGRNIAVLNLPSKDYMMKESDILIVTGWGSTDESGYGHIPDRLRFVPVPVMRLEDCQKSYRFYITPRMLCAGYATGGKDACNHDSGGPAVRDGVLLGIVSFGGKQCGDPRSPGVYSRVSEITEWVEDTITNNEANTVPELLPKIQKARQREKELQKFKARVEDKKNKIKTWLRETLKSPTFIELAKKKLKEAGFHTRRTNDYETLNVSNLDDKMIDEINLTNMINDRIIDNGDGCETDKLLRTLALHEVMLNDRSTEMFAHRTNPEDDSDSTESFIAYISGNR